MGIQEANEVIEHVLTETRESHKMQRSTTGSSASKSEHTQRTSESGFDTDGETAMVIKKRSFAVLGFDTYYESFADGLQVLRYNQTNAYKSHDDYFSGTFRNDDHDYESRKVGTNRFATILIYMNDLDEGGELYFPLSKTPAQKALTYEQALKGDRDDYPSLFDADSWQEKLTVSCRTKFSIKPHAAKAVLFYSQFPDGAMDPLAQHGSCPVLNGTKWAANIWVWNGPRNTYPGEPKIHKAEQQQQQKTEPASKHPKAVLATFKNTGVDPILINAELFFEDQFWSELKPGGVASVNTFIGHKWRLKLNGDVIKEWILDSRPEQLYVI